jgi:Uma2 family endonuclease
MQRVPILPLRLCLSPFFNWSLPSELTERPHAKAQGLLLPLPVCESATARYDRESLNLLNSDIAEHVQMSTVLKRQSSARTSKLTLADLAKLFGPMPVERICMDPPPGTATAKDVLAIHRREKRLYELVDGVLVEKAKGYEESMLAVDIATLLGNFVRPRKLGVIAGEGGMLRLSKGLVQIPDISFIARSRLPGGKLPREPMPGLAPNLAVEVLSKSNTEREMSRKLDDFFEAEVELVWYIDPPTRTIKVFTSPAKFTILKGAQTLTGGTVLPGFKVKVADIFAVLDEL